MQKRSGDSVKNRFRSSSARLRALMSNTLARVENVPLAGSLTAVAFNSTGITLPSRRTNSYSMSFTSPHSFNFEHGVEPFLAVRCEKICDPLAVHHFLARVAQPAQFGVVHRENPAVRVQRMITARRLVVEPLYLLRGFAQRRFRPLPLVIRPGPASSR